MGQILIRNLDDELIASLKIKAEISEKSLEQIAREALAAAAPLTPDERVAVSRRLRERMEIGEFDVDRAIRAGRDDAYLDEAADR